MRINYSYKKYEDSKIASDTSHFLNLIMAFFSLVISVANFAATFLYACTIYEKLANNELFPWEYQILFLIVYVVDLIYLFINFSIEALCDNIALSLKLQGVDEKLKKVILKNNRIKILNPFWHIAKMSVLYVPLLNIAIVFIPILICGLICNNSFYIIFSALMLLLDVGVCLFIKFYRKRRIVKNLSENSFKKTKDKNQQCEMVKNNFCRKCGNKLLRDSNFCNNCGEKVL